MSKRPQNLGFRITEADEPLLAKLPARYREILDLSRSARSNTLAGILGIAEGTAKSRLNRARNALLVERGKAGIS